MVIDVPGRFKDRFDAGRQLVPRLSALDALRRPPLGRTPSAVVYAIPRGALETGSLIAKELGLPLDVVLVKKLPAPGAEELAVGAVALDGKVVLDKTSVREFAATPDYIARERERIMGVLQSREREYHARVSAIDPKGKLAIVVDDGIATGLTVRAAVEYVRRRGASGVVVAAPVAACSSLATLKKIADVVVVVKEDPHLFAVGTHYINFPQVEDAQAIEILVTSRNKP